MVEGLHGVSYRAPLGRLRETVDIARMAFRGEKLRYAGRHNALPPAGAGDGKAIRIDFPPARIPVFLATLAPKSLEYTGAAADGWLGTSFSPDHAEAHFAYLRRGAEAAGRSLDDIALHVACHVDIGDDPEPLIAARKPAVAFNMGAMGSPAVNFYKDAFARAGYADDANAIQRLWLDGKREERTSRRSRPRRDGHALRRRGRARTGARALAAIPGRRRRRPHPAPRRPRQRRPP